DIGLTSWLVILIPIGVLMVFQLNYMGFLDAIILAGCEAIAIVLILLIIRGRNIEDYEIDSSKSRINVIFIVFLLLFPIFLGLFFNKSPNIMLKIISTVIWQFIFSGFGEELRYRGYYLSRINEEFGRPYELLGVKFGLGLILSSLLFGLSHVLNPFSPFEGKFEFAWWWGLWTFFAGLFFGFLKEKTNNIIAPGIAHGSDAIGEALNLIFS
ncbi:MAG: CPBP family intramembrane metalloprotease, partial [Candidatus Lokiarchaeota archaeon]|nr:CPBP family intramembrane metalloprotease [Candidatus Lokiarchaeota archaeon]